MDKLLRPCVAEMLGTFMLCFIGAGAICTDGVTGGGVGLLGIAIAHGLALSIGVTATMYISGGHLNPAVTIMFWVYKKIDNDKALFYILAQLLGALLAGALLMLLFGSAAQEVRLGTPHIDKIYTTTATGFWAKYQVPATAIGIEAVLTFLLVFAILGTTVDPRAPKVGGFAVGLTIAADMLVGGPLTGAAMNPARAFGPGIWDAGAFGWDLFQRSQVVYWIGPIIGALAAGGLYFKFILPEEKTGA